MHAYIDHRFDLLPCGVIAPPGTGRRAGATRSARERLLMIVPLSVAAPATGPSVCLC